MIRIIKESLVTVQISRDDFDRMCRENSILQGLSRSDYIEIRDLFNIGYEDFDAAVNDLWNSDDDYHDREWYVNLLRKYTGKVNESLNEEDDLHLNESKSIKESSTTKYGEVRNEFSDLIKLYNDRKIKYLVPTNAYRFSTRYEIYDKNDYYIGVYEDVNDEHSEFFDDAFTEEMYGEWFRLYPTYRKKYYDDQFKESTQLKFDDDMINDIDILYQWEPKEVEKILVKHGSDKNNDNWIDGLDLPAAYDEIMSTFRDKYSDDDEIDYDVAKVLGLVEESLNLDSDGKRLKKLISQLVLDSDEELRDYVNKIIDEVIEERNGGSDDKSVNESDDPLKFIDNRKGSIIHGDDDPEVASGMTFVEGGIEYEWIKQWGDTVHLDFDNWAVWSADSLDDPDAPAQFFVVDTDTGFIDWGPVDSMKEAQEFLQSKVDDWEDM